jgi:hypothetical protein
VGKALGEKKEARKQRNADTRNILAISNLIQEFMDSMGRIYCKTP